MHCCIHDRNNTIILTFWFSVPPTIDPLTDIIANGGDKVDLECVAAGTPTPTVEWYYRGSYYTGQKVILTNIKIRLHLGTEAGTVVVTSCVTGTSHRLETRYSDA